MCGKRPIDTPVRRMDQMEGSLIAKGKRKPKKL